MKRSEQASQQAVSTRQANGTFRPGTSGNPKGKRLGGKPSAALVKLARDFQAEAFEIVKEIARTGADEGERLRAARLALEIANTPDPEAGQKSEPMVLTVRRVQDWRPATG